MISQNIFEAVFLLSILKHVNLQKKFRKPFLKYLKIILRVIVFTKADKY